MMEGLDRRLRGTLALGLVLALAPAARGQERVGDRVGELEKKLADQERRLAEQERRLTELARDAAPVGSGTPAASTTDELRLSWDEGVQVKGRLGDVPVRLRPRGQLQLDYRQFLGHGARPSDQFVMRRTGVGFEGEIGDFGFVFVAQPLRPNIPLIDFFAQWQKFDELKIRAGHFKAPFCFDNGITGDFRTDLPEYPMVLGSGPVVAPDFHPGAEVLGSIEEGLFQYWVAVQNQPDANVVLSSDPLFTARVQGEVAGFSLGLAGAWDKRSGVQKSYAGLTPGQFEFFTPVNIRGWAERYIVDGTFTKGPFSARAAFVYAQQRRERILPQGRDGKPLETQGAYLTLAWVFFGPPRQVPFPHLVPFKSWELFSLDIEKRRNKREIGLELVVRAEWVALDDRGGRRTVPGVSTAPSTAAGAANVRRNGAAALTVGFNFSPIDNLKLTVAWTHLRVEDSARGERPRLHQADELILRTQLDF